MSVRDQEEGIEADLEREAVARLKCALGIIAEDLHWYWWWGDGSGGYVLEMLREEVVWRGYPWPFDVISEPSHKRKDKISRSLSKLVFERDEYRCVTCGTHLDLSCDHIVPESKGGKTAFENLQTMCRPCNSKKGALEG